MASVVGIILLGQRGVLGNLEASLRKDVPIAWKAQ